MANAQVIFLRSNPISPDPRTENEARTLVDYGYSVTMLGWDRKRQYPRIENKNGYTIRRIPIPAPIGIGIIFLWPIWWFYLFIWLLVNEWDVVHAADFDCYIPAYLVSKIKHKKVIYDLIDHYPDMLPLPRVIYSLYSKFNRWLINSADGIILIDVCKEEQVGGIKKGVTIIYNVPPTSYSKENLKNNNTFKIFYGGVIFPRRGIAFLLKLVEDFPNISFDIAGTGDPDTVKQVEDVAASHPNLKYHGLVSYSEIQNFVSQAHVVYALYDPCVRNNQFASPAKLFDSMLGETAVIMNEEIAPAKIVQSENCGLLVPYNNYLALKESIQFFFENRDCCKEMGENGKKAYVIKYSWNIMETRLLSLYQSLLAEN